MLEREPAVAGDVVGVRVGLEDARHAYALPLGLGEEGLDRDDGSTSAASPVSRVAEQV